MKKVQKAEPAQKVSAIIPFLNEQKTIALVVKRLLNHPLIDEVICVDDGSTDESIATLDEIKESIIIIRLKKNHGKGFALSQGVKRASNEIVAFFDADLLHLTDKHIGELLSPILNQQYRAVHGYKMPSKNDTMGLLTRDISGERAYYKTDLMPHLKEMAKTRFGVEIYLNNLFKNSSVKKVPLLKLDHLQKYEKYKPQIALKEMIKEVLDVAQQLGKQDVLVSRDSDIMRNITKLKDLKEIKRAMNMISNKDIKRRFKRVFAYISQFK